MDMESLTFPFRVVGVLFSLVFVVGILEFLGILLYTAMTNEAAGQALMQNDPTPMKFAAFVMASPDRMLVAGVLAVVGALLVLTGDSRRT